MKADGVIADYAVGGAVAYIYWDEPTATQDLDVVVILADDAHVLDPLRAVLDWLTEAGIVLDGVHAMIAGVPVQFLPAWHPVVEAGVREAVEVPYDAEGTTTLRVLRPEYLAASWEIDPAAMSPVRRDRIARLIESGNVTRGRIDAVVAQHQR